MTVSPVVDYEPHAVADRAVTARVPRSAAPAALLRRGNDQRRLRAVPTAPVAPAVPSERIRHAGTFAGAALRGVLEVIDRRRIPAQLRPMLTEGLIDSVTAFARAAPARQGGAVLRRVRLQATGSDETAFEVAATYTRGTRLHALACRVEWVTTGPGHAWRVVALHIG